MKNKKKSPLSLERNSASLKTPRNQFDLSYHTYFTAPMGMLLPSYVEDALPGDYFEIDSQIFARTQPVKTAAFTRFKQSTDFYFVPYRLLWKWWDNFVNQAKNSKTSLLPLSKGIGGEEYEEGLRTNLPMIKSSEIAAVLEATTIKDLHNYPICDGANRLLSQLGYPSKPFPSTTVPMYKKSSSSSFDRQYNPFRLLAYQYLFFDRYRNSDYTPDKPFCYNLDDCGRDAIENGFTDPSNPSASDRIVNILTPRYVQWKRDKFSAIKPNTLGYDLFDGQNDPADLNLNYFKDLLPKNINGEKELSFGTSSSYLPLPSNRMFYSSPQTLEKLRGMFAFDKLQRIKSLAGKTYNDQFEAVFGQRPDMANYCECRYLGSFDSDLNIGEVVGTAAGETTNQNTSIIGQLAGKGISSGGSKTIKFSAKEHGIVMGLTSFIPFSEYDMVGVQEQNLKKTYNEFYNPAYDGLGYQPISSLTAYVPSNTSNPSDSYSFGYQPRYMEYKTRVDEIHGHFQSDGTLKAWTCPRPVFGGPFGFTESLFYVNPSISNSIFPIVYDGESLTDPLLIHMAHSVRCTRNMSVLGIQGF